MNVSTQSFVSFRFSNNDPSSSAVLGKMLYSVCEMKTVKISWIWFDCRWYWTGFRPHSRGWWCCRRCGTWIDWNFRPGSATCIRCWGMFLIMVLGPYLVLLPDSLEILVCYKKSRNWMALATKLHLAGYFRGELRLKPVNVGWKRFSSSKHYARIAR